MAPVFLKNTRTLWRQRYPANRDESAVPRLRRSETKCLKRAAIADPAGRYMRRRRSFPVLAVQIDRAIGWYVYSVVLFHARPAPLPRQTLRCLQPTQYRRDARAPDDHRLAVETRAHRGE